MFSKVLIANRGALRAKCVQAVKELGAKAAVFYTSQDNMSFGVRMADEAYQLSAGDISQAYYDIPQIVELARRIKADAVYPGYGFLAESVEFAEALHSHGITFIGPGVDALGRVVDKESSRLEAKKAGVPILADSFCSADIEALQAAAKKFGYPVILKPKVGSGGSGTAVIRREAELVSAIEQIQARAIRQRHHSKEIIVEPFLSTARVLEYTVLRDSGGNSVVLPEVEGTIQRRFQRLLVESPSSISDRTLIRKLSQQAKKLAETFKVVGLINVEFLVNGKDAYFLEINGYLPVWHSVISELTGIDIIREQIRLAADSSIELPIEVSTPRGVVIGASINAENPENDFVPCPGTLSRFDLPLATGCSFNGTVEPGAAVSQFFEPVLSRAVISDTTREQALNKLKVALQLVTVEGVETNLPFLRALAESAELRQGKFSVGWLLEKSAVAKLMELHKSGQEEEIAALIAAYILHNDSNNQQIISAAAERREGISFWNFTSRLFNRQSSEY